MSTPDVQRDPAEAGGAPPETGPRELTELGDDAYGSVRPRDKFDRLDPVFYFSAAVACIGAVVALLGTYVTPNIVVVFAGTIIIALALVAWIATTGLMLWWIAKFRFTVHGSPSRAGPPR